MDAALRDGRVGKRRHQRAMELQQGPIILAAGDAIGGRAQCAATRAADTLTGCSCPARARPVPMYLHHWRFFTVLSHADLAD